MVKHSEDSVAVIFDMDGVIVDSALAHKKAIEEFFRRHDIHFSEDDFRKKIFGKTNREWLGEFFNIKSENEFKKLSEEKELIYRNGYGHLVQPVKGVVNFIKSLQENNIARAVATSAPRANVNFILSKLRITNYFEVVLDDSSVINSKPDPEIFIETARRLNFPTEKCVVIEDSIHGINAAKSANCKIIALKTTNKELSEKDLKIKIINDFDEITLQDLKQWFDNYRTERL